VLAEFQPEIPEPVRQDLKACLSPRRVRDPALGVLLVVLLGEDRLTRATMQGEVQDIVGAESRGRKRRDESFVDDLPSLVAH
jgi:hypothetical protein